MPTSGRSSKEVKAIIADISSALEASNGGAFADGLGKLVRTDPNRWGTSLLLANVFPEPGAKNFESALKSLASVLPVALPRLEEPESRAFLGIVQSILPINSNIRAIRKALEALPLWDRSNQETIYGICVFLETLYYDFEVKAFDEVSERGYFDPTSLISDSLTDTSTGNASSVQGVVETITEALELIHSYISWERGGLDGLNKAPLSPSESPAIVELIALASIWRSIKDLWTWVKYHGWRTTKVSSNVLLYSPPDSGDLERYETGNIRRELLKIQVWAEMTDFKDLVSDSPDLREALSEIRSTTGI